jgi:hypothetical protein
MMKQNRGRRFLRVPEHLGEDNKDIADHLDFHHNGDKNAKNATNVSTIPADASTGTTTTTKSKDWSISIGNTTLLAPLDEELQPAATTSLTKQDTQQSPPITVASATSSAPASSSSSSSSSSLITTISSIEAIVVVVAVEDEPEGSRASGEIAEFHVTKWDTTRIGGIVTFLFVLSVYASLVFLARRRRRWKLYIKRLEKQETRSRLQQKKQAAQKSINDKAVDDGYNTDHSSTQSYKESRDNDTVADVDCVDNNPRPPPLPFYRTALSSIQEIRRPVVTLSRSHESSRSNKISQDDDMNYEVENDDDDDEYDDADDSTTTTVFTDNAIPARLPRNQWWW